MRIFSQAMSCLIRTGWAQFFRDPVKYASALRMPGVELAGAKWLSERKPYSVGSDTLAFEHMPSPKMAVHVHLLVESGIHIIENLNLEELARDKVREFLFVGAPLKIEGGTGAPIRPMAFLSVDRIRSGSSRSRDWRARRAR